jgi:hypothetical protein
MGLAAHAAGADVPLSVELLNYRSTSVPPALLLVMDLALQHGGAARERVASRFDVTKRGSTRRERE